MDIISVLARSHLNNVSRDEYETWNLRSPYGSRWRALWQYIAQIKKKGVIPIDIPEVGILNVPVSLVSHVQDSLQSQLKQKLKSVADYISLTTSLTASIYLLISTARKTDKVDVVFSIINLCSTLYLCYRLYEKPLLRTLDDITVKAVQMWNSWTSSSEAQVSGTGVPGKWWNHVPKLIVLASSIGCMIAGLKPKPVVDTVNSSLASGKLIAEAVSDVLLDIFGVDVNGVKELQDLASDLEVEGNRILALTPQKLVTVELANAKLWMNQTQTLIRTVRSTNFNTSTLATLLTKIAQEVSDVEQLMTNVTVRPVPAAVYFHGEPGHGKTEFVTKWLIPALNKAYSLEGSRAGIYNLNSGKHSRTMAGEAWALYDEYASLKETPSEQMGASTLNAIISGAQAAMPGASLQTKQQTASFNGVFLIANLPIEDTCGTFQPKAKDAFMERFISFEVKAREFDQKSGRLLQKGRKPDFSHLDFIIKSSAKMPSALHEKWQKAGKPTTMKASAKEVLDAIMEVIALNQKNFEELSKPDLSAVTPSTHTLWDCTQAGGNPNVFWISGAPGIGKTERYVPMIEKTCAIFGSVPKSVTLDYRGTFDKNCPTQVVILDDTLHACEKSHQQAFVDFYNSFRSMDIIFIISNYGPLPSWTSRLPFVGSNVAPLTELYPGFWRRSGIGKRYHFEVTKNGIWQYGVGAIDFEKFVGEIQHAYFNSELRVVTTSAPPTARKWDIDISFESDTPSVTDFISKLAQICYYPTLVHSLIGLLRGVEYENAEIVAKRCLQYVARNHPELNLRVGTPSHTYVYMQGTFYKTQCLTASIVSLGEDNFTLNVAGSIITCPVSTFHQVLCNEVNENAHAKDILCLVRLKDGDAYLWHKLCDAYSLPISKRLRLILNYIKNAALDLWRSLCDNIWLAITLVVIVGTALWCCRNMKSKQRCACELEGWDDPCPFDEAQAKGKGKNKGRKSKYMHFKSVNFCGRILYEDEADECQESARIYHNLKVAAQRGDKRVTVSGGGRKYEAYYDEDAMQWVVGYGDIPEVHIFDHPIYSKIKKNTTYVSNKAAGMHCFFITPSLAILPRHWALQSRPWNLTQKGYELVPYYDDPSREFLAAKVYYHGKPRPYPGACSMEKYLLPIDVIRDIDRCILTTFRGNTVSSIQQEYRMEDVPIPFDCRDLEVWSVNAGYASWGRYQNFTQVGDCGMPVIGCYNDDLYIIGVHAARLTSMRKFVSVVLCTEMMNTVRIRGEVDAQVQSEAFFSSTGNVLSREVVLPDKFPLDTKSPGVSYHPVGAVKVMGYVRNGKPMDAKSKPLLRGHFNDTIKMWKRKVPSLTMTEILVKHREKLRTDAYGIAHVFLTRTYRLETNTFSHGLTQLVNMCAAELGDYWKLRTGKTQLNPLSVNDALNGNYQVLPVDLNTAAGVSMRLLFGAGLKHELVISDGEKVMLKPEVQALTDQQYTAAGEGRRLTIPCDANLKSELLAEGKEWKKRVYYNVPLPTILNLKRVLGPIQHALQSEGVLGSFIFSLYPVHDWDSLIQDLMIHGSLFVCLDVSGYDHSLNGVVIASLTEFMRPFYDNPDTPRPQLMRRIATLLDEIAFMPTIFERTVVTKEGGLPSGIYGTSLIDGLSWAVMLLLCWKYITGEDATAFFENVCFKVVGDDLILTVSAMFREIFQALSIAKMMKEVFEMDVTPAMDKTGNLAKYLPLSEASFCSNFITTLAPYHPAVYIPKLKEESLMGMLTYSDSPNTDELYEQYKNARYHVWTYGPKIFETYERELLQFARRHGITHHPMSHAQAAEAIWRVVISPDKTVINKYQRIFLSQKRTEIMSSTSMTRKHRDVLNVLVAESKTAREFELQNNSDPAYNFFLDLQRIGGVDWTDLGILQKPGTSEYYSTLKHNTSGVCVTSVGILVPPLKNAIEAWLNTSPCTGGSDRELRFNRERLAHLAIAARHGYEVPEFLRDTGEEQWEAYKYLLTIPPRNKVPDLKVPDVQAQAGRALPEVGMVGEGGAMVSGGVASTQMDPLGVPSLTVTPAVATSSQELADSDMAVIPTVLESIGGLEPPTLALVNYANNVVALCGKQIYTRRYNITSNTSAGTIIDELDFNPWDSNLVSRPIQQWGSLHEVFNGSIDVVLNSYSAATIVGSIILAYVPPLLQKNFEPTLENLKTVSSTVLNLKVGGSVKISITGGNLKDCAVARTEIEEGRSVYGKVYIAAYTDIVNSYGVNVSIPVVRTTSLGKNAYFSHPSYLIGRTVDSIINPGPTPPMAETLILDSAIMYNAQDTETTKYGYLMPEYLGNGKFLAYMAYHSFNTSEQEYSDTGSAHKWGAWFGSNTFGSSIPAVRDRSHHSSTLKVINTGSQYWTEARAVFNKGDGITTGLELPTPHTFQYTGMTVWVDNGQGFGNSIYPGVFDYRHASGVDGHALVGVPPGYSVPMDMAGTSIGNGIEIDSAGNEVMKFAFFDANNTHMKKTGGWYPNAQTASKDAQVTLNYDAQPSFVVEGAMIADKLEHAPAAPSGYVAVYFAGNVPFIPAVRGNASKQRSMAYPRMHNLYMRKVRKWFDHFPDKRSFSYVATLVTGETICTLLVNRSGVFLYDSTTSLANYALFPNANSLLYINYQEYSREWPSIQEYNRDQFIPRVVSTQTYVHQPIGSELLYCFGHDANKYPSLQLEGIKKEIEGLRAYILRDTQEGDVRPLDELRATLKTPDAQAEASMAAYALAEGGAAVLSGVGSYLTMNKRFNQELQLLQTRLKAYTDVSQLKSDTERYQTDVRSQTQKDIATMQMGYGADVQMRGIGNQTDNLGYNIGTSTGDLLGEGDELMSDVADTTSLASTQEGSQYSGDSSMRGPPPQRPPRRKDAQGVQQQTPVSSSGAQVPVTPGNDADPGKRAVKPAGQAMPNMPAGSY